MPAPLLYEYAVIRVVPRVERDEFLNVGVLLYCRQQRRIILRIALSEARLQAMAPGTDPVEIRDYLDAFERIALAAPDSGPIARLDAPSRFRWLTAQRSTVLQTSRVHPGLCTDPELALERLFQQQVS